MSNQNWNNSGLVFNDISVEASRTYFFIKNDKLVEVVVDNPAHLHVSKSGGHRIHTADGKGFYIQPGWVALTWTPKPGQATFVL